MISFYLVIVIFLFILAVSDLVVGVSNDAVNFLNSAVGSKVSTWRTILIVAALGVIVGCTFSSGMMEVARKGIFHHSTGKSTTDNDAKAATIENHPRLLLEPTAELGNSRRH